MSATNVTHRNPAVQVKRGDIVRMYGGGIAVILSAAYDAHGRAVRIIDFDIEAEREYSHSTQVSARDLLGSTTWRPAATRKRPALASRHIMHNPTIICGTAAYRATTALRELEAQYGRGSLHYRDGLQAEFVPFIEGRIAEGATKRGANLEWAAVVKAAHAAK